MKREERLDADVLVVGGGTSGCMAAIAAAEEGADVVLVESDSALGGIATRGGIHRYYYGSSGGLQDEVDRRVASLGASLGGDPTGFHPEAKRIVLSALCAERGVRVMLGTVLTEAIVERGAMRGARTVGHDGTLRDIRAHTTVDCTGNGALVRLAGGAMRHGRERDGAYHNYSLVPKRVKDGQLGYDNLDAGWVDPYDPRDVSRAFLRGREWIWEAYAEGLRYFAVSPHLGLREGGLIEGHATIGIADYIEDRPRRDVVARSYSHLDNHGFDTGNESDFSQVWIGAMGLFAKGLWCDVPYGSLLPKGLDGVLVGCRALSVDRDVSMGVRMQRDLHKTGEAAGVAAAMSARLGCSPRELDVEALQRRLVERGVLRPEDVTRSESSNLRFRQGALAGTAVPREAVGAYAEPLVDYLGSDERWKAVWLLHTAADDEAVRDGLRRALRHPETEVRFCAAIALTLAGKLDAVPELLERLRSRDAQKLSGHEKCMPLWVAAVALLRMVGSLDAVDEVLQALRERHPAPVYPVLLTYLGDLADRLDAAKRRDVADAVKDWLHGDSTIGEDYLMHGRRQESLRWSLELHAARILRSCGDDGLAAGLREKWAADDRGYVRNAAARMFGETPAIAGRADEVSPPEEVDVAVFGGGAAGLVCAVRLARRGLRVALVEPTGNLLVETTRARQTDWSLPKGAADGEAAELLRRLEAVGARRGDRTEPVLAQLVADRWVAESGVRVRFEACVARAERRPQGDWAVRLVYKSGSETLIARRLVDCSPEAAILREVAPDFVWEAGEWQGAVLTATLLGAPLDGERRHRVVVGGAAYETRLRPAFYLYVYFENAAPGEREAIVGAVFAALRSSGKLPEGAALAHLADDPWTLSPGRGALPGVEAGTSYVAACGGAIVGVGGWHPAVRERGGEAVGRLLLAGEAAADAVAIGMEGTKTR